MQLRGLGSVASGKVTNRQRSASPENKHPCLLFLHVHCAKDNRFIPHAMMPHIAIVASKQWYNGWCGRWGEEGKVANGQRSAPYLWHLCSISNLCPNAQCIVGKIQCCWATTFLFCIFSQNTISIPISFMQWIIFTKFQNTVVRIFCCNLLYIYVYDTTKLSPEINFSAALSPFLFCASGSAVLLKINSNRQQFTF